MCNNIFQKSGQCNTYLAYAVEDDNVRRPYLLGNDII